MGCIPRLKMAPTTRSKRVKIGSEVPGNSAVTKVPRIKLPKSKTKFDNLNDDCYRLILKQFPIFEQLRLRRTSARWNNAVCTNFRSKKSLKIFPDFDGMCSYYQQLISIYNAQDDLYYHLQEDDPDELIGRRVTESESDALRNPSHLPFLFPNLTKLVIYSRTSTREVRSNITHLPGLLRNWQELESLTIFDLQSGCIKDIASMSKLRRLELYNVDMNQLQPIKPFLTLLGQLEHFTLGKCFSPQVYKLLHALNPDTLRRLSLNRVRLTIDELRKLFTDKPTLTANLTHLAVMISKSNNVKKFDDAKVYGMTLELLRLIVDNCPRLTFIQFSFTSSDVS